MNEKWSIYLVKSSTTLYIVTRQERELKIIIQI